MSNEKLHHIVKDRLSKQIKSGRPRHFDDAQQMLDECMEYFEWLDNNRLELDNIVSDTGSPVRMSRYKQRAPTVGGMCLFLGISLRKWEDYKRDDDELIRAVHGAVSELIRERKFAYGVVNEFNARIISMDLGLTSKVALEGGEIPITLQHIDKDMDPKEAAASYAATLEEG